jgi:putative peptide zinc metalloprotease protein
MRRLTTALVLAVVAIAGWAAPTAIAQDNAAVAVNTKDDSSLFKLAFSLKQVSGDVVDQTNAAVAYANCKNCQTVAIAIQVLIVMAESPSVVVPENLAIAINDGCVSCVTMALAYQFVIGRGLPLTLTPEGRREVARIRRALRALRKAGLTPLDLAGRVEQLVGELRKVLATQLVPRGENGRDSPEEDEEELEAQEDGEEDPFEDWPQEESPPSSESEPAPQETSPSEQAPPAEEQPAPAPEPAPETAPETAPSPPPDEGGGTTTAP